MGIGPAIDVPPLGRAIVFPANAELAKGMKGASSHLINHDLAPAGFFRWQGNYGAFSVGEREIDPLRDYIRHQEEHHARQSLRPDWEQSAEPQCPAVSTGLTSPVTVRPTLHRARAS